MNLKLLAALAALHLAAMASVAYLPRNEQLILLMTFMLTVGYGYFLVPMSKTSLMAAHLRAFLGLPVFAGVYVSLILLTIPA